jgi:glycosyltransferase involved in cell wall biosynthesis
MKVALFVSDQSPQLGGGYTFEYQILAELIKSIPNIRHSFIIYTFNKNIDEFSSLINIPIVSLYKSLGLRFVFKIGLFVQAIFRKIQHPTSKFKLEKWREKTVVDSLGKNQVNIVLALSPNCITVDYPYITIVWDLQHRLQPYFPEVSLDGQWEDRERNYLEILRRASFIITGTEVGKAEIQYFYQIPSERIKVIPFPTPQFTSAIKKDIQYIFAKYNLPNNYLFYPAQFWPHKNHVGLLLAIKHLKDQYNLEFPLVFVGSDKGNISYIREVIAQLQLSNQVHFLGFVPQEDIPHLYQNAFALTFVTFFGPDNLPPIEAMALGCPVIASNVSGATEQLGEAALLVDPKQPEEIALAVKSLWDDSSLRQRLIDLGFKRAKQWTTEDYVKKLYSVIDDFEAIRRCWQ